ncbi:CHRD domain-containing protein [Nonomuraea sp. NPDC001699]
MFSGGITVDAGSTADGRQEVPAPGTVVGDKDGRAAWANGARAHFATVWKRIAAPTNGHIHRGVRRKNGPVVVEFFAAPNGLPAGVNGIAGTGRTSVKVAAGITDTPRG